MKTISIFCLLIVSVTLNAATYYVDCAEGDDKAAGVQPTEAWRSLARVNATKLDPGDRVLLRRGTVCKGALTPSGSGATERPIVLAAYGAGPPPRIEADGTPAAVRLFNQSYWHIRNIEATGSSEYGIFVGGDSGTMAHFRITDVLVHGVHGKLKAKNSGLIVFALTGSALFEDIVIDGATVWDTTQWAGIIVNGAAHAKPLAERRSRGVVIRNSIAHDVWGDGIVLYQVTDGLIERSAAWNTGMQPTQTIGTPNGIWTWRCADCTVRECESYFADSPGVDGGAFDIDWGNDRNIVELSYGHDTQAYCFSVFGAGQLTTTASIVRHNVCAGNGRSPRLARHHGAVHLTTWDKGSLDGVAIHDNVILWEPPVDGPVVKNDAAFQGSAPNVFSNNSVWSAVPLMAASNASMRFEANLYWVVRGRPEWHYAGTLYQGFPNWRGAGNDRQGRFEQFTPEPKLSPVNDTAELEQFGFDAGSVRGRWALVSLLDLRPGEGRHDSRAQAVNLRSAAFQHSAHGLRVIAVAAADATALDRAQHDWRLEGVEMRQTSRSSGAVPFTVLIGPEGKIVARWKGYTPAKDVIFPLRFLLGGPIGVPTRQ